MSNERAFKVIEIEEGNRMNFLPKHLGIRCVDFESYVYQFANKFSDDYDGGYWNFYDLDNLSDEEHTQGFFMSPDDEKTYHCINTGNGTSENFNAETFGVVVSLFAFNHLCFTHPSTLAVDKYYALRDYVLDYHEDKKAIARFLD